MQTLIKRNAAFLAILFVLFTACSKDDIKLPSKPANPSTPFDTALVVSFSNTGLPIEKVDSIVVILRDANRDIKVWESMVKNTNSYHLDLRQLALGDYTGEILVFSKKQADNTARQYALPLNLKFPLKEAAVLHAPKASFNDTWMQRGIFYKEDKKAIAIVALDPRDGQYGAYFTEQKWLFAELSRISFLGSAVVGAHSTRRNITGVSGFEWYSDFEPYVNEMKDKQWQRGFVSLRLQHEDGDDFIIDYEYTNN